MNKDLEIFTKYFELLLISYEEILGLYEVKERFYLSIYDKAMPRYIKKDSFKKITETKDEIDNKINDFKKDLNKLINEIEKELSIKIEKD